MGATRRYSCHFENFCKNLNNSQIYGNLQVNLINFYKSKNHEVFSEKVESLSLKFAKHNLTNPDLI